MGAGDKKLEISPGAGTCGGRVSVLCWQRREQDRGPFLSADANILSSHLPFPGFTLLLKLYDAKVGHVLGNDLVFVMWLSVLPKHPHPGREGSWRSVHYWALWASGLSDLVGPQCKTDP